MSEPPNRKAFLLRLDPAVAAAIETMAAQELRSANAQVEFMLREALTKRGRVPAPAPASSSEAGKKETGK